MPAHIGTQEGTVAETRQALTTNARPVPLAWAVDFERMTEIRDPASLVESAQQAAAVGDYATAAHRLRDAADWQERQQGPDHPTLVNTLNNLGVVLERSGRLAEAEAAYRRAYAIARKVYAADHPFVATSAANLREFCDAHGLVFDPTVQRPPARPKPAPVVERGDDPVLQPVPALGLPADESQPRSLRIPFILGVAVVALGLIAWLMSGSAEQAASPGVNPVPAAERGEAAPPVTSAPAPSRVPAVSAPSEPTKTGRAAPPPVRETPASRPTPANSSASLSVVDAELCQALVTRAGGAEWTCTPAGASVPPGRLAYYTRIRSSAAVDVQHRWYRGDALQQRVELPVQANPGSGYRTYSRRTIGSDEAGPWRVELRNAAGALLDEQRFVVR